MISVGQDVISETNPINLSLINVEWLLVDYTTADLILFVIMVHVIILRLHLSVHLSVTEGQRKRFDLEPSYAMSLATER